MVEVSNNVLISSLLPPESKKKEGRSADSKMGEELYNAIHASAQVIIAATFPEVYLTSFFLGSAVKLITYRYDWVEVNDKTKTALEEKAEAFGDSSAISKTLASLTKFSILPMTYILRLAGPYAAFEGVSLGMDLSTRAIRLWSSLGKTNKVEDKP